MFKYKGYMYKSEMEHDYDRCWWYHWVYTTNGTIEVYHKSMPMSSSCKEITESVFKMWIDCEQPTWKIMGLTGPAYESDIVKYYYKWIDKEVDSILLGVEDV